MKVLLILNQKKDVETRRFIVNVKTKLLKDQLISLLEEERNREAFNLLLKKAQVETYLAPGQEAPVRPAVTLIEDWL